MNQREAVIAALGHARLEPYLRVAKGNRKHALHLYRWGVRLASAVQETLGLTEVFLRNAIDKELLLWNRQRLGSDSSWLLEEPASPLRALISGKRIEALRRAEKTKVLRTADHPRYGLAVTHNDVLAHTMFGMWKDILPNHAPGANTERRENQNRARLWSEAVSHAFPHVVDPTGELTFWRVFHLHGLRNRVSHMDSLLNVNVRDLTNDAFDLVGSISPDLQTWLTGTSTIRKVLREKPQYE